MNDDLHEYLGTWHAPAVPEQTTRRIAALLDDTTLPGPRVATRRRGLAVPLAYAAGVAALVAMTAPRPRDAPSLLRHDITVTRALVEAPNMPASAQSTAIAVSAIDLEGFELIARPHMRVNRRAP